jgi:hypothetical protein
VEVKLFGDCLIINIAKMENQKKIFFSIENIKDLKMSKEQVAKIFGGKNGEYFKFTSPTQYAESTGYNRTILENPYLRR